MIPSAKGRLTGAGITALGLAALSGSDRRSRLPRPMAGSAWGFCSAPRPAWSLSAKRADCGTTMPASALEADTRTLLWGHWRPLRRAAGDPAPAGAGPRSDHTAPRRLCAVSRTCTAVTRPQQIPCATATGLRATCPGVEAKTTSQPPVLRPWTRRRVRCASPGKCGRSRPPDTSNINQPD